MKATTPGTGVAPRSTMKKKILIAVAAGLLVLAAGAVFGWRWLQSEVDRQARSRLQEVAQRLGATATVEQVALGLDGTARLQRIVLTRGTSTLTVHDVRVVLDPLAALRERGLGAVSAILVDGVRWHEAGDPDVRALVERVREVLRDARRTDGTTRLAVASPRLRLPRIRINDVVLSTEGRTLAAGRAEARTDDGGHLVWDASGTVDVEPTGAVGFRALGRGEGAAGRVVVQLDRPLSVPGPRESRVEGVDRLIWSAGRVTTGPAVVVAPRGLRVRLASIEVRLDDGAPVAVLDGASGGLPDGRRFSTGAVRFDGGARRVELSDVQISGVGESVTAQRVVADLDTGMLTATGLRASARGFTGEARQVSVGGLLAGDALDLSRLPGHIRLQQAWVAGHGHRVTLAHADLRRTPAGWSVDGDGRLQRGDDPRQVRVSGTVTLTEAAEPVSGTLEVTGLPLAWAPTPHAERLHLGPDAVADASVRLTRTEEGVEGSGTVKVVGLSFQHWRLAPERIGPLAARATFEGTWRPGHLRVQVSDLRSGRARAEAEARVTWDGEKPAFDVTLRLPRQDCAGLREAVPSALLAGLPDLKLQGQTWLDARFAVDLNQPKRLRLSVDGDLAGCQVVTLGADNDRKLKQMATRRYRHQPEVDGQNVGDPVGPATREFIALAEVPEWLRTAAIATEDRAFYEHQGIRLGLIRGALKLNLTHMRYVYGGSTITQQLVKNLFLTRRKDLARKLEEAVIAVQMERTLTKDRILELYLNCIEYGPGIWGLTRAAKAYYGKDVASLTHEEGVYLMAIKPYPTHGWHNARRGQWRANWVRRMRHIFERIHRMGAIDEETLEAAGPDFRPAFALAE